MASPADITRAFWLREFGVPFDPDSTDPRIAAGGDIYERFLREDVRAIADCHAMALLPGWEKSKGVARELRVADVLSLPRYDALTMLPIP